MEENKKGTKDRSIFYKGNYGNFIVSVIFTVLFAGANIAVSFVLKDLMDVAYNKDMQQFKRVIVTTIVILLAASMIGLIKLITTNRYIKKASEQFKNHVFEMIMKKNINSFNEESLSTYLSAFSNDLSQIEGKYLGGNLLIINNITLFVGSALAMAYMNLKIFGIAIGTCLIPIVISIIMGPKVEDMEKKVSNSNANFIALTKDILAGFTVVKSFRATKEIAQVFSKKNVELEGVKRKARDTEGIIETINDIAGMLVSVTVIGTGVFFAVKGVITAGVVIAYIDLLNYLLEPISELGVEFANRGAAIALIDKLYTVAEENATSDKKEIITEFKDSIVYENVCFGYEKEQLNLCDINLKIEKGKSYAIVGSSGSGKSTLLNLLLGYHDNYSGSLRLDNHELKELNSDSLYDIISTIQQNVFVFDNSIVDNITLFKQFSKGKIDQVVKQAGLEKLIEDKGNDYNCGENGSNLSGGEKQRISIARSLIRNSPIILMDEATAALDTKTSFIVEDTILSINGLTKIIITHKMNRTLLKKYDQIVVMSEGRIVEKGTFEQLMMQKGHFYSMNAIANSVNE